MRIIGLDVLRGIAVLLVLFRHGSWQGILQHIGWAGVDLFFVLSGFLIASMMFSEYKRTGNFSAKTFLIRRGFKIYPAFYIFLIVSLLVNAIEHNLYYEPRLILAEVFFLQSYLPHVWTHTWSVAVEEHFYLALALWAVWRIRRWNPDNRRAFIFTIAGMLLLTLVMRFVVCYPKRFNEEFAFFSTHLRVDGILIGVLAAYLQHFTGVLENIRKYSFWLICGCVVLICPLFFLKGGNFWMNTIGLTMMNIAFGIVILFFSQWKKMENIYRVNKWLVGIVAFIGIHSYSIYLWHLFVQQELYRFLLPEGIGTCVYIIVSVMIGVLASYIIEKPFLSLREKVMPSVK